MTPNSLLYELQDFFTLLLESEIAMSATKAIALSGASGFRRITWATNTAVPGDLFRKVSPTVSEYRDWVNRQGYSAVLFDGSLVQISYDFSNSDLARHRLLYFPCPFDLDPDLLRTFSLLEVIDLYQSQNTASVRLRSPLRFDFDALANTDTHPASHMTFQWSHARIPVMAPISPGHFIQFVFKSFYPAMWKVHSFLQEWPQHEFEPTITPEQKLALHLNSVA